MPDPIFNRHDRIDIFIHWFNAVCWLLLMVTGVGLIQNPALDPLGAGYPAAVRSLVGGGGNLLAIHEGVGLLWIFGFLFYLVANFTGARFFLAEIFSVRADSDLPWLVRKMALMTLGPKVLRDPSLPAQGFYNMGQKAYAQVSVIGSVVIAVTGLIMFFSDRAFGPEQTWLVGWAVTLHFIAVGVVFAGLLVHVYMAAISPEERPGFRSMFTGHVPEDYAKHHHRLWWNKVKTGGE